MISEMLARALGLNPNDLPDLQEAVANRLQDARAFALGGKLSSGEVVPGQAAVLESNAALRRDVAALMKKLEAKP